MADLSLRKLHALKSFQILMARAPRPAWQNVITFNKAMSMEGKGVQDIR
jgi:hypothetical protein